MKTFIDLFAGIGGFRTALENKGLKCVFSSEIDKHAREAYKKNFGEDSAGDVCGIPASDIPKHDILCAGFPCQTFSINGKRSGLEEDRGKLFFEIIRIAKYRQPKIILLENVKNILKIDDGRVLKTINYELDKIGYRVETILLNASFFGVPQKRERAYFICFRKDLDRLAFDAPKKVFRKIFLKDILLKNSLCSDKVVDLGKYSVTLNPKSNHLEVSKPLRIGHIGKGRQGERIYSTSGHSVALTANSGGLGGRTGLYYVKNIIRKLHAIECKRLMGFPDNYFVSAGAQGLRQLGNSVVVPIIEKIYDGIREVKNYEAIQ